MLAAVTATGSVSVTVDAALAKDSAAEAQQKAALEALKKQQEAILAAQKAAQEAAKQAAKVAAQLAAQQAAAQKAAQQAAQKAAQEAAAQQAAAQKAAQQAAAQKAAQEAAAQKAAQQAAAQKAAQEAAAQKAAQQAASSSKPQTTTAPQAQTTSVSTSSTATQATSAAQPAKATTATSASGQQSQRPPQSSASNDDSVDASADNSDADTSLPNDADVRLGMHQFDGGDFLKTEKDRANGPARPDWAPDPALLNAPRASSSIQHPEPVLELAKDLKSQIKGRIDEITAGGPSNDPAGGPTPTTPEQKSAQAAPGPRRPSGAATQLQMPSRPGEELLATGLSDKQVKVLSSLGVETQTVTLPASGTPVQKLRVPQGMSADQLKAALTKQMPLTPFVPNHRFIIFGGAAGDEPKGDIAAQSSCQGDQCFGAELVHWTRTLNECTRDVKVGIIDTSFDTSHPTFRGLKASHGVFLNGEQPSPLDWHGTAVLSELAGHPDSGTPGLIPHANFFLAAAFRTDETGNASTDTVRLLSALEWMEALGVQYVNMSFTGPRDDLIEATIRRMSAKGVVFIAAAGNHGPNAPPSYPAAYQEVVAVTAINRKGESYRGANRGSYIDVAAPGVDIPAALPNGRQGLRTGTSFAAPFVTAILAARNPQTTEAKSNLLTLLKIADLGPPGRDPIYGAGLALAPEQCSAPVGTVAARPSAPAGSTTGASEASEATMFSPTLSGFAPASGLGFRQ